MTRHVKTRRPDAGFTFSGGTGRPRSSPMPAPAGVASAPFRLGDPGLILASNARVLPGIGGPCARCERGMLPGQRVADLTGGGTAHVGCVSA